MAYSVYVQLMHGTNKTVQIRKLQMNIFIGIWVIVEYSRFRCKYVQHYKNTTIQIYWKFYNQKKENFQIKNSDSLMILLLKT